MKLTYTVQTRTHTPANETERRQAALKRKYGCRAILQALAPAPSGEAASARTTPTLPQPGASA